jgi:hypothetical protein
MKHFITAFIIMLSLTSCGIFKITSYSTSLVSVESPANAKIKYGETKIINNTGEDGITKYSYEDDYINIVWYIGNTRLNFLLTNKSGYTIKLPWDDMAYVDEDGKTMRVIHSGIRLVDRNAAQAPSVVPKNATLNDILIPSENIYYVSGQYGGWQESPLFPKYSSQEEANNSPVLGKIVRVIFPIIIEDVQNEYVFEFSVDSVVVK